MLSKPIISNNQNAALPAGRAKIMKTLKEKSESQIKKELGQVNTYISFLEKFIDNMNKNRVWVGLDKGGYKPLTASEIKNQKSKWLKNNTQNLVDHLKLKGELEKELKNRYKKGIEKACVHLKTKIMKTNNSKETPKSIKKRLEYLRKEIRAERISYGEIAELQSLSEHIDSSDVELLQWAGVEEN